MRTNSYSTPPNFITYYGSQVGVEDPDIVNEVDGGVGVLAYRGHGSKYSTATGWNQVSDYFNSSDVISLANPTRRHPTPLQMVCVFLAEVLPAVDARVEAIPSDDNLFDLIPASQLRLHDVRARSRSPDELPRA